MRALKAHVRGGRLVLHEPTDLPEGEAIELVPLDEVLAGGGDYLDEEERQRARGRARRAHRRCRAGDRRTASQDGRR